MTLTGEAFLLYEIFGSVSAPEQPEQLVFPYKASYLRKELNPAKPMRPILVLLITAVWACPAYSQTYAFDFADGSEGWTGDFADYFIGEEEFFELEFSWETLPQPLDTTQRALKLVGANRSDDLFMFLKRKIEGLAPFSRYEVSFFLEMASNVPTNAIGIGGPPGEAVVIKVGATTVEPQKIEGDNNLYRMNIDKGNQSQPGRDMDTIGHIGVVDTTFEYTLIERSTGFDAVVLETDSTGTAWVCVGTDSGFEGTTTLYYNRIIIDFVNSAVSTKNPVYWERVKVFPNPAREGFRIEAEQSFSLLRLFDASGRLYREQRVDAQNYWLAAPREKGPYFLQLFDRQGLVYRQKLMVR